MKVEMPEDTRSSAVNVTTEDGEEATEPDRDAPDRFSMVWTPAEPLPGSEFPLWLTIVLTVPVAGQTFKLTGTATQTSISTFSGISTITSTGTGCQGGCTGSLGNNVSVIGQLAGAQGTSAGVLYGFDSRLGNVSGVIVFRR